MDKIGSRTVSVGDPQGHQSEDARMSTDKAPSPAARKEHHA